VVILGGMRMALGQGAAGGGEGDDGSRRDGKKIPLQEHLPTDFAY
jgi:hypothetical protein